MNTVSLRGICAASVFFGIALCLLPEGREKQIASLCAAFALVLMFIHCFRAADWESYALSLAELRGASDAISASADAQGRQLRRFVIEQECGEYIWDKAVELELEVRDVAVGTAWSEEGVWVPQSAVITLGRDGARRERLSSLIEAQLGIPAARQEWRFEENPG